MAERTLCIIKPDAVGAPWMDNLQAKNEEEEEGAPPFVPVQEVRRWKANRRGDACVLHAATRALLVAKAGCALLDCVHVQA